MHSNKENPVEEAQAGHIYAMIGLKDTTTGDTLCDPSDQVVLESMTFPAPVISVAIEPKTKSDQEKLSIAIQKLAEEDPTFQVEQDEETGQTIIKGMGELHLDNPRRPHAARVQGRGRTSASPRWPPRDHPPRGGEVLVHAQEADRWVPGRSPRSSSPSSRWSTPRTRTRPTSSTTR
jgi:hypothetical protein